MRRKLPRSARHVSLKNAGEREAAALHALAYTVEALAGCRDDHLLDFDAEADLEAIIPMPASIPLPIRAAITKAAGERFTYAEDFDEWLHAPHDGLRADTPFERVVRGDGMAVLVALLDRSCTPGDGPEDNGRQLPAPALRVVR